MTRILAAILLVLAVGCTQDVPPPEPVVTYRNASAQIASQTDVTAERMTGDWYIRQSFAGPSDFENPIEMRELPSGALQMRATFSVCQFDQCVEGVQPLVLLEPSGPGRWTPLDAPFGLPQQEIWVMWMDFDSRTMAIGTPSGEFGWILDKNPAGGQDRITAARDIMDWFGYDVARLEKVE